MNIFEALSSGKGSINEENTSSFLAYLLNPIEDHGMKDIFIKDFLNEIDKKNYSSNKIEDYNIRLELPVEIGKKTRYIDIVFETADCIIAIENKIKSESLNDVQQLSEEFCGLKEYTKINKLGKKVSICLLAPRKCRSKYNKIIKDNNISDIHFVEWETILFLLRRIIIKESRSKINPFDNYMKQTLKAFIYFMNKTLNDSIEDIKHFSLFNEKYKLIKYKSNKYTVEHFITDSKTEEVCAIEIIRNKLNNMNPNEYSIEKLKEKRESGDNVYTTHILGKELFELL